MNKIKEIINENKNIIGIWGYPDPKIFMKIKQKYPLHEIIDLDVSYETPNSGLIPDNCCRIIRNIIDNSITLKENLDVIVAAVGEEKCDSGRFAAKILEDIGLNVIQTKFNQTDNNFDTPISASNLPLKKKILTIMDNVIEKQTIPFEQTNPEYGFWGVAPNDLSFMDLFPDTTHVYGWTRAVEAGRPADLELEMFVDKNVPTVFFAQTFCAKMQLAKYLAKKHDGLYVDVDDKASNSVRAKIEAFIKLG